MARRPRKQYEDDDGRTIVNMNVEGTSWYESHQRREEKAQARAELREKISRGDALTTRQTIRYTFYATLAGLCVVGFVAGGTVLFVFLLWLLMR